VGREGRKKGIKKKDRNKSTENCFIESVTHQSLDNSNYVFIAEGFKMNKLLIFHQFVTLA
jgi:hypothetical protein